ncbi:hypothetical protein M9458_021437, partial [Cirrhinus mrigala]
LEEKPTLNTLSQFTDQKVSAATDFFKCHDTNDHWHPYKEYSKIYPDWQIDPDPSTEASAYWKYVMAQFNQRFAEKYNA